MKKSINNIENKKAITLISLVVTIVILVILAAVTINMAIENNGLFNKAKFAKQEYVNSSEQEKKDSNVLVNYVDNITNLKLPIQDETIYYNIVLKLGAGSACSNTSTNIEEEQSYETIISKTDIYDINSITVKMGDENIVTGGNNVVDQSTGRIYIEKVTGDIEINVVTDLWSGNISKYTNASAYMRGSNDQEKKIAIKNMFENSSFNINTYPDRTDSISFKSWASQKVWFQYNMEMPISATHVQIKSYICDSGYEPVKDFYITASNDINFTNEIEIFRGTHTPKESSFTFESKGEYQFYRIYITSWYNYNSGDGQNIVRCFIN